MPAAFEFDDTLGAAFIGHAFACLLFGILLSQIYTYYERFPDDKPVYKLLVLSIGLLETLDQVMVSHALYIYNIKNYGNASALLTGKATWSIIFQIDVAALVGVLVKMTFAMRVWRFSNGNVPLTLFLVVLSLAQIAFATVFTIKAYDLGYFSYLPTLRIYGTAALACGVFSDITVAVSLCYYLRRVKGLYQRDDLVSTLMVYAINTGIVTSLVNLCTLVFYDLMPNNFIFIGFYFVLSKLYAISLLAALNTRKVVNRRGTDRGETTHNNISELFSVNQGWKSTSSLALNPLPVSPTSALSQSHLLGRGIHSTLNEHDSSMSISRSVVSGSGVGTNNDLRSTSPKSSRFPSWGNGISGMLGSLGPAASSSSAVGTSEVSGGGNYTAVRPRTPRRTSQSRSNASPALPPTLQLNHTSPNASTQTLVTNGSGGSRPNSSKGRRTRRDGSGDSGNAGSGSSVGKYGIVAEPHSVTAMSAPLIGPPLSAIPLLNTPLPPPPASAVSNSSARTRSIKGRSGQFDMDSIHESMLHYEEQMLEKERQIDREAAAGAFNPPRPNRPHYVPQPQTRIHPHSHSHTNAHNNTNSYTSTSPSTYLQRSQSNHSNNSRSGQTLSHSLARSHSNANTAPDPYGGRPGSPPKAF